VRGRNDPRHRLVLLEDVERLTGLSPEEVLRLPDTQQLVRVAEDGTREELIRIPVELLGTSPDAAEAEE
jgi:hypothetical protein